MSAICAGCLSSAPGCVRATLSFSQSPRPPSRLANARIHWPYAGTPLDGRLGPPPGRGQKTTDRQTGPGAMGLQSEFDLNARSEKTVHFEKLDGANGGMATALRLGDS